VASKRKATHQNDENHHQGARRRGIGMDTRNGNCTYNEKEDL
jgi:hypothetical protein